jgi:hypothetical protein
MSLVMEEQQIIFSTQLKALTNQLNFEAENQK